MNKILIRTPQEFDNFILSNNTQGPGPHTCCYKYGSDKPEQYPCFLLYKTECRDNGPDEVVYEIVYLSELTELLGIPSNLKITLDGTNSGDGVQMKVDFDGGDFIEVIGSYLPKNRKDETDYGVYCMAVNMKIDGKPHCAYYGHIARDQVIDITKSADGQIDHATAAQMLLVNPTKENIIKARELGVIR